MFWFTYNYILVYSREAWTNEPTLILFHLERSAELCQSYSHDKELASQHSVINKSINVWLWPRNLSAVFIQQTLYHEMSHCDMMLPYVTVKWLEMMPYGKNNIRLDSINCFGFMYHLGVWITNILTRSQLQLMIIPLTFKMHIDIIESI